MGFIVYFLNTFPSPATLDQIFRLFTLISWKINSVKFENSPLEDILAREENQIVISPFIERVSVETLRGYTKIVLPLSCRNWSALNEIFEEKISLFKTYPLEYPPKKPLGGKFFVNERELVVLEKPPLGEENFYTCRGENLEEVVGKLLRDKGLTLATAESCTGGMVASSLVNVPGSSEYFIGSVVAYSNEVKEKLLGVKRETLDKWGAVSAQTAKEMAEGVKKLLGTDIGISTTGIAGPSGGTETKPVGLTYFGISFKKKTVTFKRVFHFDRNQNRISATYYLLFELFMFLREV
ncbi:MAG TPA: CinA family protein [Aquifex sp.]|nr:CinA family protein [Aquifex sp.]